MAMVDNFVIHDETKRRRGWGGNCIVIGKAPYHTSYQ